MTTVDGFDVAARVARLGLASSAEGVEMLERYVRRAAAAYDMEVALVVLPEQVVLQEEGASRSVRVRSAPGIFRLDQGATSRAAESARPLSAPSVERPRASMKS